MIKKLSFLSTLLLMLLSSFAQENVEVSVPGFDDKYSATVKQLEQGQADINYKEFRESFLESEQFKIASQKSGVMDSLQKEMYKQMGKRNYKEIVNITKRMLSIDYTSMIAHKILRQTYTIIGDTANATKYRTIQFGLLNSIVKNGDGTSCATGWPVIQVAEEYFILQMIGARLISQSTDTTGGICDKMLVITKEGDNKNYYFDIRQVMEGYKKLGIQ